MQTLPRSRSRQASPFRRVDPGSMLRNPLAAAISAILATGTLPLTAQAAAPADEIPEIIVTATRRAEDIQDIPLNIAAIGGERLSELGIADLATLGRNVPGLYVVNQGKRTSNRIVVRGLNVTSMNSPEGIGNDGGEVVSTYVGEIPLYIDMRMEDMDRVEVLLGPQGTLYGAGTLGGAIRYIPRRPDFSGSTLALRGGGYSLAESDDIGARGGFTFNAPFGDIFAFRASVDYVDDPGFIDNPYLVRRVGVSDPEPNFSNPAAVAANLFSRKDVDTEKTVSGRLAIRGQPEDGIDVNFTHYFQDMEVGGRTINHAVAFGTGEYVSAVRVPEPNDRQNRLTALEITADLGFAELTSATGYSKYSELGQRDQTDFLIALLEFGVDYSYESFPTFSSFTRERQQDRTFSQELRLVSRTGGPLNWIGGIFYNNKQIQNSTEEFTPGYDDFLATFGGGTGRPDDLEYIAIGADDLTEKAIFGEVGYFFTDKWQATVGARYYDYDYVVDGASDIPVVNTAFGAYGPEEVDLSVTRTEQSDSGTLLKFNTSYSFTGDLMGYLTVSEGYRIGSANSGAEPCPNPVPVNQQSVCFLPDEVEYTPDKTVNYELGMRSQWFDERLTLNVSAYYIDWQDPQLAAATFYGNAPITKNGEGAESRGFDISFTAELFEDFVVRGSYAQTKAELSDNAPNLLTTIVPPGFATAYVDAIAGDRLPGSPEQQGTLSATYEMSMAGGQSLKFDYGLVSIGDVITRTGLRAGGETLGGYTLHSASVAYNRDNWMLSLYSTNLFNKYAVTGVRSTRLAVQTEFDINGAPVRVRNYYYDVVRPREVGLRFTYDFNL